MYSPVPGQLEALCQQEDYYPPHDESTNHETHFETFIPGQKKKYTVLLEESHAMFFVDFHIFHIYCVKLLLLFDKKVSHL